VGTDTGGAPGPVRNALALAVRLGHLDELLLQRGQVLDLGHAQPLVGQVLLLLEEVQLGEGVGVDELFSIDARRLSMEAGVRLRPRFGLEVSSASR
jgi:hypothetical protein